MKLTEYQKSKLSILNNGGKLSVEMTEDGLECILEDSEQKGEYLNSETFKFFRDNDLVVLEYNSTPYFSFYNISESAIELLNTLK